MPRKNLIRNSEYYYHVTSRTNNRDWFNVEMDYVWKYATASLAFAQKKYPAIITQFVLMSNHYHLLIKTPNEDIDKFMYEFNKLFTLKLRIHSKRINKILGGRYKWSLITTPQHYYMVYRYVYQNPLRAGLSEQCQHYLYSTLHYEIYSRVSELAFKLSSSIDDVHANLFLESNAQSLLDSINEKFDENKLLEIKYGVKKTTFKPVTKRKY